MTEMSVHESDFSPRKIRIALTVMIGIGFGTTFLLLPAYPLTFLPMTREFGWTPTEYGFAMSLLLWFGASSGPFLGWLVDRIGVRPMIIGGTLVVGLVALSLSRTTSLWQFYVCFALLGVFGSTAIGYSKVIGALFTKHRGKAMAVLGLESSIVGAFVPKLIQYLLAHHGWRGTYQWLGVIMICVAPLIYFSLEEPGTAGSARSAPVSSPPPLLEGMTAAPTYRTRTFWALVVSHILGGVQLGVVGTYLVPMLMAHGFAQSDAPNFQTTFVLAGAAGSIAGGFLMDRSRNATICAPFCWLSAISLLMLGTVSMGTAGHAMLWIMAIVYGFGSFGRLPMAGYFQTRFFGLRAFAAVNGVQLAIMAVVFGFATPLVGKSQEITHSYDAALIALAIASALSGFIYLFLGPYKYAVHAVVAQAGESAESVVAGKQVPVPP
jgi:MFS family permease